MSSSKNNITPTYQTPFNDQAISNNHALPNNQTLVVQVPMDRSTYPSQPSKVAQVSSSLQDKKFKGSLSCSLLFSSSAAVLSDTMS
jgi:hypothetical protein